MQDYKREEYKVFELFDKKWALVTAGNIQHYNCCTVSWEYRGDSWEQQVYGNCICSPCPLHE